MTTDSGDGGVVSGRLPPTTHDRFERYVEENEYTKSEGLRRLVAGGLDSLEDDKEENSSADAAPESADVEEDEGLLARLVPSMLAALLAATVVLFAMGDTEAGTGVGLTAAFSLIAFQHDQRPDVVEGTESPLDAQKSLLRGLVVITAAGPAMYAFYSAGMIIAAGLVEILGFLAAAYLLYSNLNQDAISEFASARSVELWFLLGGFVAVIVHILVGVSETVAFAAGLAIIAGWCGIAYSTVRLAWSLWVQDTQPDESATAKTGGA